ATADLPLRPYHTVIFHAFHNLLSHGFGILPDNLASSAGHFDTYPHLPLRRQSRIEECRIGYPVERHIFCAKVAPLISRFGPGGYHEIVNNQAEVRQTGCSNSKQFCQLGYRRSPDKRVAIVLNTTCRYLFNIAAVSADAGNFVTENYSSAKFQNLFPQFFGKNTDPAAFR